MVETRKFVDAKQCFSLVYEGSYDQKIVLHSYNYIRICVEIVALSTCVILTRL